MRIPFWVGIAAAAVAGCGKSPRETVLSNSMPVRAEPIRVVSFNIRYGTASDGPYHWDNRKEKVFSLLADCRADLTGLQEALDFQVEQIGRVLADYEVVFACRDDGKRAGESCPIFYRKDRFERLDSGTFWFSDTPDVPGSRHWGNQVPRICTWVSLSDRVNRQQIRVFNVHLDHQSQSSREKSLQCLAERIKHLPAGSGVIVMGDFNMDLSNPAFAPLLDQKGLHLAEAWRTVYPDRKPIGTWHDFGRRFDSPKIDHIFVSAGASVLEAGIDQRQLDGLYPSDHFPVWAVIQWSPTAAQTNGTDGPNGTI